MTTQLYPIAVALPRPLFEVFTYYHHSPLLAGVRVRVPFSRGEVIGVVTGQGKIPDDVRVKSIIAVLDDNPLIDDSLLYFLHYGAQYYQHPFGEVLAAALPNILVHGGENTRKLSIFYTLTHAGVQALKGSLGKKQRLVLQAAKEGEQTEEALRTQFLITTGWLRDLCERGWLSQEERFTFLKNKIIPAPNLNEEQSQALMFLNKKKSFSVDVLDGVRGSGKTEVYIRRIEKLLENNGQVLLLAPEIGLVEMLFARLSKRLPAVIVKHHSGMSDRARLASWQAIRAGDAKILVGTRSALFSEFNHLRGILVDECHDQAYKQQDGFCYHARDMAVVRAKMLDIPILLGTATPPLEVWKQIQAGHWGHIRLTRRVMTHEKPKITLDDVTVEKQVDGLSQKLINEIRHQLGNQQQVLLFLNRRGYSPLLRCEDCHWQSECEACDSTMTAHINTHNLQCHHCGRQQKLPSQCPKCNGYELKLIGYGTQRLEQTVRHQFPQARVLRIDTDAFTTAKQFQQAIEKVENGEIDIILGTQWLSKGHHFPALQLVAVIDADNAFYSNDFRAEETLAQLLVQVGGRAGRENGGHIWIQTRQPHQPVFRVLHQPYHETLDRLAKIREQAMLPPYSAQILLTAQHKDPQRSKHTLSLTREGAQNAGIGINWQWYGPAPAIMTRKNGQHRYQLLIQSENKKDIQHQLAQLNQWLLAQGKAFSVRVGIDVDPLWIE